MKNTTKSCFVMPLFFLSALLLKNLIFQVSESMKLTAVFSHLGTVRRFVDSVCLLISSTLCYDAMRMKRAPRQTNKGSRIFVMSQDDSCSCLNERFYYARNDTQAT